MSGGANAKTMYDQVVDMFKSFPTIKINWNLVPIPPAVVVNEAVQTAVKIEDAVAERQQLENRKLELEIEKEEHQSVVNSDTTEKDETSESDTSDNEKKEESENEDEKEESENEDEKEESENEDEKKESENEDEKEELENEDEKEESENEDEKKESENENDEKSKSEATKEIKVGGEDVQTGGILFTKEECSFF